MVEFTRKEWPINRYVPFVKVDKQVGYYVQMKNDNQVRITSQDQFFWADGNDAPKYLGTGGDSFEFLPYTAARYAYTQELGYLAVEQGSWDILGQATRMRASQGFTARSLRVANAITLSTNYPSANYAATATAAGAGAWTSAASATPYILETVQKARTVINQQTNGVVQLNDIKCIMNPNTANTVRKSAEFIDFLKQSPEALALWDGVNYNSLWGMPANLYGLELVIDNTMYTSDPVGTASPTKTFTIPDNTVAFLTKQNAISPSVGKAFSTFEILGYSDFEVFVNNDNVNRRYGIQVVENTAEVVFSGQSGYLVANVAA